MTDRSSTNKSQLCVEVRRKVAEEDMKYTTHVKD